MSTQDNATEAVESLPEDFRYAQQFAGRLYEIYGSGLAAEILRRMAEPGDQCFWHNPLIETDHEQDMPGGEPLREEPALYCLPRSAGVARTAAAGCGSIYIQNPSSYVAAKVLRPQPGEEVLDLAAAPGGKTIAMAAMMNNQGRIAAVEPVRGRFHHLRANVARCGVRIAEFYQKDGRKVGALVPQRFDRVLLDAPCSSESRMRWSEPDTYRHWSLKKVKECQRKQKGLLRSAFESLKPGGRLLYCTCSFGPEENELVVAHLLRRSTAVLLPVTVAAPKQVAGLTAWRGKALPADMARTVRILPDQCWDGFFLALLCRPSAE